MGKFSRDIIILVKDESVCEQEIEMEVKNLHGIISSIESRDMFCNAHELVARNRITRKKYKILNAVSDKTLKPFYFLLNKN